MPALACCFDASPAPVTPPPITDAHWSPSLSSALYNIDGWGDPYFAVNSSGNISVRPHGSDEDFDLLKIVKEASGPKSRAGLGLQLPLIVRFPDVLKNRLESLNSAFHYAIQSKGYNSHYQGVYPVKCNQDRFVVDDIVEFGSSFRFGLEAGSKPELLLAMTCLCKGNPEALLVCNGFKDTEYISLALVARKLALNTVIVLEQEEELDLIIELSNKLHIRPVIGMRAKLRTKHSGHFGSTSGEKGKFGLTTSQILRVVKMLEQVGMLDCLQLLHFHIGSQIPSTSLLADSVGEATQIYCELVRLGGHMRVIDVGGGLGIDYDGSKSSNSDVSVGYGLQEYAASVVEAIQDVCDRRSIKHPIICSESGRAIVSHHSVLVFEVLGGGSRNNGVSELSTLGLQYLVEGLSEDARNDYHNLTAAAIRGDYETCLFCMDDMKRRCVEQFKEGSLGIEELAAVDGLCDLVKKAIGGAENTVRTYHVNLSVFTSIPDFWGIQQVFPIVPIHRLDEKPSLRGILSDLTCDSDGKIDKFINGESSLPLHELKGDGEDGRYYLGMFLGGAYEEALGGVHNLFGGPSLVRVSRSEGPHSFVVTSAVSGHSCGDVLRVMQHEPEVMFETLKQRAQEFLHQDSVLNAAALPTALARSFSNMPYLLPAAGEDEPEQWSYCFA